MRNIKLTLAIICTAHILGMIPFSMYPTLIPTLQVEWGANNTEIGWVAGIYFGGYLLAVTILVPLTDRIDSRWVYLCSIGFDRHYSIVIRIFDFRNHKRQCVAVSSRSRACRNLYAWIEGDG